MFQILNIDESNYKDAYSFLKSVPSISGVEDSILKNGVVVMDRDHVIGSISFEIFDHIGLIRYFVFKRSLPNSVLIELIDLLQENARKMGLKQFVCVADNPQIEELFIELGFLELKGNIFINEESISVTNFASSSFLYKEI